MSKGLQIAMGGIAVVLLLGWYAWGQIQEGSFVYYQNLSEFRAEGSPGQASRVHGYVAAGTIERDVPGQVVRFVVQEHAPHASEEAGGLMPVVYASLETPDLFKDGAEVVVEGRLSTSGDGTFEATNLLAKCPSKFEGMEPPEGGMPPSQAAL
ncbi:MAG: cytochrome c maturation protein CcmE [Myxococcota bacterium]|nr:cytochrome c maturation protein CcmE [Myxococcota bacterium]